MDTPNYDQSLSAYQRAFQRELKQIVESVSVNRGMQMLDVPCGSGFYARHFARRLGSSGRLDCVDLCSGYLARTRQRLQHATCAGEVHQADAYDLPFNDATFDLVWCAQSLISLDDPVRALTEMRRVTRRGGRVAILENDIFHHVILPWPVDLEIPIERAIQMASKKRFGSSGKLAPTRRLSHLFEKTGFESYQKATFAADRQTPWSADVERFLRLHVRDLWRLVGAQLSTTTRQAFKRFTASRGRQSLFGAAAQDVTCLNVLYQARK